MATPLADAAATSRDIRDRSMLAKRMVEDLRSLPPDVRRTFMAELDVPDLRQVFAACQRHLDTPYALYDDAPADFVTDILGETMWSKQRDVLNALVLPGVKRVIVPAGFGLGKCARSSDVVTLADGTRATFGSLVGRDFQVMGWREDGSTGAAPGRAAWNRVEPIHRVELEDGTVLRRNAAHPLWTGSYIPAKVARRVLLDDGTRTCRSGVRADGWTPVSDLTPGRLVLVPSQHPAEGTVPVPPHHLILAANLLADGALTQRTVGWTKGVPEIVAEMRAAVEAEGGRMWSSTDSRSTVQNSQHHIVGPVPHGRPGSNPVLNLTRHWGLHGHSSLTKRFPDWVWTLPNDQLAGLVGRLIAADGWLVTHSGGARLGLTLRSPGLIDDVTEAMLRLGLRGNTRTRTVAYDGSRRPAWEWWTDDHEVLRAAFKALPLPGKEGKVAETLALLDARTGAKGVITWRTREAPEGYQWRKVRSVTVEDPEMTVAVEVPGWNTYLTHAVEHNTLAAAKATCWFVCVHPVGTVTAVTTATRMRQVIRQLWPHVRKTVARAGLPGECDMVQWKMPDRHGVDTVCAYGFTAVEHDEASLQGIHAARLLLVVDEAGGIGRVIGGSTRNLLTGDARMLAIGNPPTDDEASWFETAVEDGYDPDRPDTVTIGIPATDSPAVTGEDAGPCHDCPPSVPAHPLATHLVDEQWITDAIREHGEDAPYVIAKVHAKFPRGGSARAIPASFVDAGVEQASPDFDDPDLIAAGSPSVDLRGHPYATQPNRGAWIRLGADIAADGGDEFVIARAEGDLVRVRVVQSGAVNQNAMDVAGKILEEIRAALILAEAIGTDVKAFPVDVKVDAIGIGWGVVSTLEAWKREGVVPDGVRITRVVVSEQPDQPDNPKSMWRPKNKRAELWLNGRQLLTPDPAGRVALRLDVDPKVAAQLRSPTYFTDSSGKQAIEKKADIVSRLGSAQGKSPDRAEAVLLAVYSPRRKKARLLA